MTQIISLINIVFILKFSSKSPAVTVVATSPSVTTTSSAATIQTFQITTSTGIQTIRVAAPSSLPTALLARTLQLSAQQQSNIQGPKATGSPTIVNGTGGIKQVNYTNNFSNLFHSFMKLDWFYLFIYFFCR